MRAERESLVANLVASAGVVGIVGDRIYPGLAPLDAVRPYITYQLVETELSPAHDRATPATKRVGDKRTWLLSLEATSIDVVSDLADHVRTALDGATDATNLKFRITDEADLPFYKDDNSGDIIQTVQVQCVSVRRPV